MISSIGNAVSGVIDSAKSAIGITSGDDKDPNSVQNHPSHPDMTRFMQAVNSEDLARPNLFLVRFDNFFKVGYSTGGNIHLYEPDPQNPNGSRGDDMDYTIGKLTDVGKNALMNSDLGGQIMGAYNPKLMNPILSNVPMVDSLIPTGFDINKELAMLVKSASFPGTNFDVSKVYVDRKPMTGVTGRSVDTLKLTFFLTPNHVEREVFLLWMKMVHDPYSNQFGFYDEYKKKIDVYPLTRKGVPMSVSQCDGCFPIRVGEVQYDVDNNNQIATFEVEFALSECTTKGFKGQSPFFDQASSVIENVATNPLAQGIF